MSKKSRQRQRMAAARAPRRGTRRRHIVGWAVSLLAVAIIGAAVVAWRQTWDAKNLAAHPNSVPGFRPPTDFASLCALPPAEIDKCDIALMNLLCAEGLRGSEGLDISNCLWRLGNLADYVKKETDRNYHRYREHPGEFKHSEGYYRMMMLVTVLQQDMGIHYNPAHARAPTDSFEPNDQFFADAKDVFINGLTREAGLGTCSSLPVFYVALGRWLGYPLKLARAKGHLFARWVEGDQSFNIEATSVGFVSHPDDEYRKWPFPFTAEEEQTESYLKPLTPAQELATFLGIRGQCLLVAGDLRKSVGALANAYYQEPQSVGNQRLFAWAEEKAFEAGALPKRMQLEHGLNAMEIPPGPRRAQWLARKNELLMRLRTGQPEGEIEPELAALRAEMARGR